MHGYVCMQGKHSQEIYDHFHDFSKFCFCGYKSFVVLVNLLVFDFLIMKCKLYDITELYFSAMSIIFQIKYCYIIIECQKGGLLCNQLQQRP